MTATNCHFLTQFRVTWLLLLDFVGYSFDRTTDTVLSDEELVTKIHLDTNNWSPVTKCVILCAGRKTSLDRIRPKQIQHCGPSGIVGEVNHTMSIDFSKQILMFC